MKKYLDTFNENLKKKTKYQISVEKENDRLLNLYPNIKFSDDYINDFLKRIMINDNLTMEEAIIRWKIYYTKNLLEPFEIFYNKYKPYELPKHWDLYYSDIVKEQFDKIINGELYVNVEFMTPDSPIRNYMKLIHFDENKINRFKTK